MSWSFLIPGRFLQIFLINYFCHIPLWSIIVCRSDLQQQLFARMKTNKARQWWVVFSFIETSSFVLMQSSTCCRELVIIELNNQKNKISCPHSLFQPEFSTFQHIVSTMRDNNPPWHYYWWLKLFYIWTLGTMLWSESPVTSAPESQVCVTCVTGDINNLLTMKNHPHQTHETLANHGKYENNHFYLKNVKLCRQMSSYN